MGDDVSNRVAALDNGLAIGERAHEVVIGEDLEGVRVRGQYLHRVDHCANQGWFVLVVASRLMSAAVPC